MLYTQYDRSMSISTPLGKDMVLLQAIKGEEGISQLFKFDVHLLSLEPALPFDQIIGQPVTVRLGPINDPKHRYIDGYVSEFSQIKTDTRFSHYRAKIVPWLWFLTRTIDCRIFQNLSVTDIILQVFQELSFATFRNDTKETYLPHEYCVQYRETDCAFVSRLMEEHGIFYFFEHEEGKHTLVLADKPAAHQDCPGQKEAKYDAAGGNIKDDLVVSSWQMRQELKPGQYALTDYNFKDPTTNLRAHTKTTVRGHSNDWHEVFEYPGRYLDKDMGTKLVDIRMQEQEATHCQTVGMSTCRTFSPGYQFSLKKHPRKDWNQKYVLTKVVHKAGVGHAYTTEGITDEEESYKNKIICIPATIPYRPRRITPKPIVQGSQTAVVVGPSGEEIFTDDFGRVKVQFHWDRLGKRDENSSCWIRVSQVHAGKGFGGIDIPRIDEEVIVHFLEGDPDQPIIIGRVYNKEHMPPTGLPDAGMISGLKSNSTPGGDGFNEMMMDDTKGKEKINIHAQYDMSTTVENDHSITVVSGNDTHKVSAGTRSVTVKGDTSLTVQAGSRTVDVTGGDYSATSSKAIIMKGNSTGVDIFGKPSFKASGESTATVTSKTVNIIGTTSVEINNNKININGTDIKIEGTKIEIIAGGGSITIDGAGVSISGNTVKSGATGANEISGGVVKIN